MDHNIAPALPPLRFPRGANSAAAHKGDAGRRNTFDQLSKLNGGGEAGQKSFVRLTRVIRVALEWRNLSYSIPVGRGKKASRKTILSSLSSHVPPGRLVAIMGAWASPLHIAPTRVAGRQHPNMGGGQAASLPRAIKSHDALPPPPPQAPRGAARRRW